MLLLILLLITGKALSKSPYDPPSAYDSKWHFVPAPPEDGKLSSCAGPALNLMTRKPIEDHYEPFPNLYEPHPVVIALAVGRTWTVNAVQIYRIDFFPCMPYVITYQFSH